MLRRKSVGACWYTPAGAEYTRAGSAANPFLTSRGGRKGFEVECYVRQEHENVSQTEVEENIFRHRVRTAGNGMVRQSSCPRAFSGNVQQINSVVCACAHAINFMLQNGNSQTTFECSCVVRIIFFTFFFAPRVSSGPILPALGGLTGLQGLVLQRNQLSGKWNERGPFSPLSLIHVGYKVTTDLHLWYFVTSVTPSNQFVFRVNPGNKPSTWIS